MTTFHAMLDSELDSFAMRDIIGTVGKVWR